MKFSNKHGISLIAVLMFMLAATTASIVVYRYLGQENFLSGARLKQSEAYQASESGLDAVQSWLTNRAADAGALVGDYILTKQPILLTGDNNVLGTVGGTRDQKFQVFLIGVDIKKSPMKLKFLSIGEARDGSKVSQSAIFSVEGLYNIFNYSVKDGECTVEFNDAVYGQASGDGNQTQANWSDATITNPDFKANQIKTTGDLTAIGDVTVVSTSVLGMDSITKACPKAGNTYDSDKAGNTYIAGNLTGHNIEFCGDAYIGGDFNVMTATARGDLYIKGNLLGNNITVSKNLTIDGSAIRQNKDGNIIVEKDLILSSENGTFYIKSNKSEIKGNVWISPGINLYNDVDVSYEFKLATGSNSKLYMEDTYFSKNDGKCTYTTNPLIYFYSPHCNPGGTIGQPTTANRSSVKMANTLDGMKEKKKIQCDSEGKNCTIPDPIELPDDIKTLWLEKAQTLLDNANETPVSDNGEPIGEKLPASCVYLFKTKEGVNGPDISGNKYLNKYCKSTNQQPCQGKFIDYMNSCYNSLKSSQYSKYLYDGGDNKFLPIKLAVGNAAIEGKLDGNFILIYDPKPATNQSLQLTRTTEESNILVYLPYGASKLDLGGSEEGGNYFIFSDGNIDGTTGNGRIKGTIFMAKGATIGGIQDLKVTFNEKLFKTLLEAGLVASTEPGDETCKPASLEDLHYIPVSSRLSVKLENKEITREKAPEGEDLGIKKSILVMPRVVRLGTNELKSETPFNKFYAYMYLNGAKSSDASPPPTPSTAPNPTCQKCSVSGGNLNCETGSTNLNQSGTNEDGLYKCRFGDGAPDPVDCPDGYRVNGICYSNFYARVAGETGNPKISISPASAIIPKEKIGDCATINLAAEEENPNDGDWRILINVKVEGNYIWKVHNINSSCEDIGDSPIPPEGADWYCKIPNGQTSADVLNICSTDQKIEDETEEKPSVKLELKSCSGDPDGSGSCRIDPDKNTSTISIYSNTSIITRIDAPDPEPSRKDCPADFVPNPLISVSCMDMSIFETDKKWRCQPDATAVWSANKKEDHACEILCPEDPKKICETGEIQVLSDPGPGENEFPVGPLKWKYYSLIVTNTSNSHFNIKANIESVPGYNNSNDCQSSVGTNVCKIYHSARYTIESNAYPPLEAKCNPETKKVCSAFPMYLGRLPDGQPLTGSFTPTGKIETDDVFEIVLRPMNAKEVFGCVLDLGKRQKKVNEAITMKDIVLPVFGESYECENQSIRYSILGTMYNGISGTDLVYLPRTGTYAVEMEVSCNSVQEFKGECSGEQLEGIQ